MKAKLKLRLWQDVCDKRIVSLQILEQEGIKKTFGHIFIYNCPEVNYEAIYLRGKNIKYNFRTSQAFFNTEQEAAEYIQKVISWLDEVFAKTQSPKRGDLVMVKDYEDMKWEERIFVSDLGENARGRIHCVFDADEYSFANNGRFRTRGWNFMEPIKKSFNKETGIYYFEGEI